ncbi:hypothetical protein GGD63_004828 [Bradyrhizobium sp. cir1]|nr:hypothetical protein [Bradyrhizobium sp. cir1]
MGMYVVLAKSQDPLPPSRVGLRRRLPPVADNNRRGVWVLAFARRTTETYTAIFRCSTGAPVVRLSAASMMALASMP